MSQKSNIVLVGYMGSGKTTLGKKLAKKMGYQFIDTDALIEESTSKSIPEIFNTLGEEGFRKMEHDLISSLKTDKCVISVGGGLPCFYNNMELINKLGVSIYLQRPLKELANRLINAKHKRPLLINMSESELLVFIGDQINERERYYLKANIVASREVQDVSQLIELRNAFLR